MGDFIDDVAESDIIAIDNDRRTDCTVWGDIMTQYAGLRRITATVIDGVCRDVAKALGDGYPLFTRGRFMRTGKDRVEVAANACWPWCRGPELKVSNLVRTGRSSAKIGWLHSANSGRSLSPRKIPVSGCSRHCCFYVLAPQLTDGRRDYCDRADRPRHRQPASSHPVIRCQADLCRERAGVAARTANCLPISAMAVVFRWVFNTDLPLTATSEGRNDSQPTWARADGGLAPSGKRQSTENRMNGVARVVSFFIMSFVVPLADAAEPPAWVKQSDENAQIALAVYARYWPESAGRTGVAGLDEDILDLKPGVYDRYLADAEQAAADLRARLPVTTDARVREDLEILIKAEEDHITSAQLNRRLMLDYIGVAEMEFSGIRALLDPQVPKARQAAALTRLRRYAGLEPGTKPLTQLAIDRTEERFGTPGLTGPYVNEVNKGLGDTGHYIDGMRELFEKSDLAGWQEPFDKMSRQLLAYDDWVRVNVIPKARPTNRLPPEIYADNLKRVGVDIAPQALIAQAQFSFGEIQNQLRALAVLIAKQRGYKSSDYRDVLRELKKNQVVGEAILPLYRKRLAEIEAIIARENIVTLPVRKGAIRLASPAETAQVPAPHMVPPRMIGNTGEYGEFVLPVNIPGAGDDASLAYDDFTSDGASWTLTSHESRPGHELQFAGMVEQGVSIARAVYAWNSVDIEGWGLYAEAEVQPYEPLDGQMFALQHRLMRAARAFLDPMVNLGLTTPERVTAVLRDDVVLSRAMVKQEVDRYTFDSPGQATAYYYGYMRLIQLRTQTELTLGPRFDRKKFNDFVLSQGLLPPDLLRKAVETDFISKP